jgi:hypothetical protein
MDGPVGMAAAEFSTFFFWFLMELQDILVKTSKNTEFSSHTQQGF